MPTLSQISSCLVFSHYPTYQLLTSFWPFIKDELLPSVCPLYQRWVPAKSVPALSQMSSSPVCGHSTRDKFLLSVCPLYHRWAPAQCVPALSQMNSLPSVWWCHHSHAPGQSVPALSQMSSCSVCARSITAPCLPPTQFLWGTPQSIWNFFPNKKCDIIQCIHDTQQEFICNLPACSVHCQTQRNFNPFNCIVNENMFSFICLWP